jgi:cyclohexanecarboxylate-CoA ligase
MSIVTDRLIEIARSDPDRTLVFDQLGAHQSYEQVAEQVGYLIGGLRSVGIGPGDVVIVQLPNWTAFLVVHLALSAVGAVTATIPIVYRSHELKQVVQSTDAKMLIVPARFRDFDYVAMAKELRAATPTLRHIMTASGDRQSANDKDILSYEVLIAQERTAPWHDLKPGIDDLTALGFTSGTTGNLKAAMYSTRVLDATNAGLRDRYKLNEDDRAFACSPLGHAVGFTHALRMTLTTGGAIVMMDKWDCGEALAMIAKHRCTYMAAATPFLNDMVYHPALADHGRLPSLRLFLCGGATIPRQLMKDARERMPHTFTSPLWGMTECGGVTTCPLDAPEEKLFTTDGLPCGSMELKVVDGTGATLAPGQEGELMARGPMMTLGYYRQPKLTDESYLKDGFFRTGDLARLDTDGYVRITGRIKDLIIRGGVNIAPAEIEDVLFKHPRVASVAVVGSPDPRLGERICAYVVLSHGNDLSVSEIQGWMKEAGVAQQKWPERIQIVPQLPMTTSGKVQKFVLREMAARPNASETQLS